MKTIQTYETVKQEGILLNANENPRPLSEAVMAEILEAIKDLPLNRYPDTDETELLQAYGKWLGLDEKMLLAGNGSDQMLGYLIGTFLGRDKILYTFDPDFSMYDYYAGSYEAKVRKFAINEDGSLDIDAFIEEGRKNNADLVMFSNPNNPSGHCLSLSECEKITAAFAPVPVVIDEAYIEFADEESAVQLLDRYDNLYVTRTLSKAFGLAGIRVGFLISDPQNMAALKSAFVPYALNALSMKAACVVLAHSDEVQEFTAMIRRERRRMLTALSGSQRARYIASQANFIYGISEDKERLMELLKEAGIVIRNYKGSRNFRVTISVPEENDLVLDVLKKFEEEKTCGR